MSEKIKAVLDELFHELKHIQVVPCDEPLLVKIDCDVAGLCETCILERMCERCRRVEDACIDPIIPGRAIIVKCEAYRQETQVEEVD
jgi:hypothetical protein